ncbi:hypothetical protein [Actinomadura flavalba]|uniref:hypothetical protein n=1 Tax=Actinomadura flavalba TaxID=1120938 RepID=UPI00035F306E|nr:hypothetical protein [Actinomadura flavalba]
MGTFRALLVIDTEGYGSHRQDQFRALRGEIRRVVREAAEASGFGAELASVPFREDTGDGMLAALPTDLMPLLLDRFPQRLQEALEAAAPALRGRGSRLRLRVALHHGPMDDADPEDAGASSAVVEVNRLLGARPLKDALLLSDPEVSHVAFLLSAETYRTYVALGEVALRPSQCTPVEVAVKEYERPGYLYVPKPSRRPLDPEPAPAPAPAPAERPPAPGLGAVTFNGDGTQAAFGNSVGGDLRQERR